MIPQSVNDETFTTVFIATGTDDVIRDLKTVQRQYQIDI